MADSENYAIKMQSSGGKMKEKTNKSLIFDETRKLSLFRFGHVKKNYFLCMVFFEEFPLHAISV